MTKFVVTCTTPEEMRDDIAAWLDNLAIGYRTEARLSMLKRTKIKCEAQAIAVEAAAKFIKEIVIEKPLDTLDKVIQL